MRIERKIMIELVESGQIHNYRLIAETIAKKFNERIMKHEKV